MTENNRIEYKRELNDRLEKEVLKGEAIISGAQSRVYSISSRVIQITETGSSQ